MHRELNPEDQEQIVKLLADGDRIGAISLYISITGANLTDAQNFVKSVAAKDGIEADKPMGQRLKGGIFGIFKSS